MAYKDKDRQREANRQAQARFKAKGITDEGITSKGITEQGKTKPLEHEHRVPVSDQPKKVYPPLSIYKRGKDTKHQMTVMERLFYKPAHLLKPSETNFVSLPGRACYGVV